MDGDSASTDRATGVSPDPRVDSEGDRLAYDEELSGVDAETEYESGYWDRWYLLTIGSLLVMGYGVVTLAFWPLFAGFVATPIFVYLDLRFVESVTPKWQPDKEMYLVGSYLFMPIMIPIYFYRRNEAVGF